MKDKSNKAKQMREQIKYNIVWVVQVIVAYCTERYHMTTSSNQFCLYNSEILVLSHKVKHSFVLVNMKQKDEITVSEKELDQSQLWLMARKNNKGGYEPNVLTVVEKIVSVHYLLLRFTSI